MNNRIKNLSVLIIFLLAAFSSSAFAAAQYAVAVGASYLYQMKYEAGVITSIPIFSLGTSVPGRSATVSGGKLVITETNGSASSLRVFSLTGGSISEESKINLPGVYNACSVSADKNGGMYVGDNSSPTGQYAYVSSVSSIATTGTIGSGYGPLRDVATVETNGFIISEYDDEVNNQSFVSHFQDGTLKRTISLDDDTNYPRIPIGVAASKTVNGTNAYIISKVLNTVSSGNAALNVCTIDSDGNLMAGAMYALSGFAPSDIITFTQKIAGGSSTDYLALIGRASDGSMLIKTSQVGSTLNWTDKTLASDGSSDYRFIGSEDGNNLWYTRPSGSVGVFDTSNSNPTKWTFLGEGSNLGGISSLVAFTSGMDPVVPEPSSLASLAVFGLGALGIFRKKK